MRTARPYFACERLSSVLVVFELHHRLILLEPFKTLHKGNFARSPVFNRMTTLTLMSSRLMRQCSMCVAVRDLPQPDPSGILCSPEGFLNPGSCIPLMAPSPAMASIASVCSSQGNVTLHAAKHRSNAAR